MIYSESASLLVYDLASDLDVSFGSFSTHKSAAASGPYPLSPENRRSAVPPMSTRLSQRPNNHISALSTMLRIRHVTIGK